MNTDWPVHNADWLQDAAFFEYDTHLVYGWYMYYFWILVVSLGICSRLLAWITKIRGQKWQDVADHESHISKPEHGVKRLLYAWLKRYITVPAAFGDRCSQPLGWCTIPPRAQTLTITAFVVFNAVLCCTNYRLTDGNLYWPKKSDQLLRFVSDRTGIISLANLPLVWLFGMRNDVLMWLTGWGFGTYNAFHRWSARVATLQAVVHSLGYTLMITDSKLRTDKDIVFTADVIRWRLAGVCTVLEKTLLLEWRAGYCSHVPTPCPLVLWHQAGTL